MQMAIADVEEEQGALRQGQATSLQAQRCAGVTFLGCSALTTRRCWRGRPSSLNSMQSLNVSLVHMNIMPSVYASHQFWLAPVPVATTCVSASVVLFEGGAFVSTRVMGAEAATGAGGRVAAVATAVTVAWGGAGVAGGGTC